MSLSSHWKKNWIARWFQIFAWQSWSLMVLIDERPWKCTRQSIPIYYMEESVLLGTKPLVDSIRHFIRDPSGVFSVCHLCECRIVQWRHDSRLLLLLNWFLHIIKRTLHVGSKIWILCSRGKNNIYYSCPSNIKFISSRHRVISSIYACCLKLVPRSLVHLLYRIRPCKNQLRMGNSRWNIGRL